MLISFEVTTVTSMDSQEPTCCDMATCWLLNEVDANMLIRRVLEALNSTEGGTN